MACPILRGRWTSVVVMTIPSGILLYPHNPLQWVLPVLQCLRVASEPDDLLTMALEEASAQRQFACRVLVVDAMACRTNVPMGLLEGLLGPLPAPAQGIRPCTSSKRTARKVSRVPYMDRAGAPRCDVTSSCRGAAQRDGYLSSSWVFLPPWMAGLQRTEHRGSGWCDMPSCIFHCCSSAAMTQIKGKQDHLLRHGAVPEHCGNRLAS